jgi:hypothetical protein
MRKTLLIAGVGIAAAFLSSTPSPVHAQVESAPRILFLGDSVADTVAPALNDAAAARGIPLTSYTRPGCGIITGIPAFPDGTPIPGAARCDATTPGDIRGALAGSRPQYVAAFSTWETADRTVDGQFFKFGTPEADAMLLGKLEELRAMVAGAGAELLLVTVPPRAEPSETTPVVSPTETETYLHLNELYRMFARTHADVGIVDLAGLVCHRGPPCPANKGAVVLRPRDGGHFSAEGAAWLAPHFLRRILWAITPPLLPR